MFRGLSIKRSCHHAQSPFIRTLEVLATKKIRFGANNQDHYAIVTEIMDGSLRKLLKEKGKLSEK